MITSFAAWPKVIAGRVVFTASCPCGQDARWEQVGFATSDVYEISCSCQAADAVVETAGAA